MIQDHRFRADPHRALCRALSTFLDAKVTGLAERPWASITLDGCRHRLRADAVRRPERLAALGAVHFDIPGHVVVSVAAAPPDGGGEAIVIEALTLSED